MRLDRLCGTETEYAIRLRPGPGGAHPGNDAVFDLLMSAVRGRVRTRPGRGLVDAMRKRSFTENGGSLYYESLPHAPAGGLIEGGTPECRGPTQLLVYQRAQDTLVAEAADDVAEALADGATVSLLKNCRDAAGNVYGTQENFEADIASGRTLLLYRAGLVALAPLLLLTGCLYWLALAGFIVATVALALASLAIDAVRLSLAALLRRPKPVLLGVWLTTLPNRHLYVGRLQIALDLAITGPLVLGYSALLRATAFRAHRRGALAFLVSRCVVSGAGSLTDDDRFVLSERADDLVRLMRWSSLPRDRGLLETGHLLKGLMAPAQGEPRRLLRLFARRQRLQLGCGDANMCQVAEYLKLGATLLVLDLVEAGALADAPQPADPVAAMQALSADPTLRVAVPLRGGGRATGLELQRFYQRRAAEWLEAARTASLEAHQLVQLWGEVLDALERDPGELLGRLDWVSKRYLLETAGAGLPWAARKKIDLRYHELRTGYHAWMEREGLAPAVVDDEAVRRAIVEPPGETPARRRGRLVRELADRNERAQVSWDSVRVGGKRGHVVRLDDWRR